MLRYFTQDVSRRGSTVDVLCHVRGVLWHRKLGPCTSHHGSSLGFRFLTRATVLSEHWLGFFLYLALVPVGTFAESLEGVRLLREREGLMRSCV